MRLSPQQLTQHLKKTLAKVYLISGDEPLQKLECIDQIRKKAQAQGYEERVVLTVESGFDWDAISQATHHRSLFASRKIIELRLQALKPGKTGAKALLDFIADDDDNHLLLISSNKADKATLTTKWLKAIEKAGVLITVWPISQTQLPAWIKKRLPGKTISQDAANWIALRVEGNLLAAKQELDKLDLLIDKTNIEVDDVITAIADNARYDVFNMIESAFLGNANRALYMLSGLRREGAQALLLLGAFMWEFRRLCSMAQQLQSGSNLPTIFKDYRIWEQKKPPLTAVLKRHPLTQLQRLLAYCGQLDKTVKSQQKEQFWDQFSLLLLAVAGINTRRLLAWI